MPPRLAPLANLTHSSSTSLVNNRATLIRPTINSPPRTSPKPIITRRQLNKRARHLPYTERIKRVIHSPRPIKASNWIWTRRSRLTATPKKTTTFVTHQQTSIWNRLRCSRASSLNVIAEVKRVRVSWFSSRVLEETQRCQQTIKTIHRIGTQVSNRFPTLEYLKCMKTTTISDPDHRRLPRTNNRLCNKTSLKA